MRAYRPYETLGMVDSVKEFTTTEELAAHYQTWAESVTGLSPVTWDDRKVVFSGTNVAIYDELRNEGYDDERAMEEALETLIVESDDEDIIEELSTWVSF